MIAAPVQCDVDGIPKGSHYVRVPIAIEPAELLSEQIIVYWVFSNNQCEIYP